jgi:hypothetical protein
VKTIVAGAGVEDKAGFEVLDYGSVLRGEGEEGILACFVVSSKFVSKLSTIRS